MNELVDVKNQIKGLSAQLEAAKQMISEGLAISLQLRANLVMFTEVNQEQDQKITELNNQIVELNKKFLALEPVDAA